jgi:hypothetical protein
VCVVELDILKNHQPHGKILRWIGRECKRYLDRVARRETDAVAKQPCPFCGCREVWYWDWYERKEGSIPYGDGHAVAGPIPIRRFWCPRCCVTFSWRPPFLVFGLRFAAPVYQQAFREWALGRRRDSKQQGSSWYELGLSGLKAFFRRLDERLDELLQRLEDPLKRQRGTACGVELRRPGASSDATHKRKRLWYMARRLARTLVGADRQSRLSCHFPCLALAQNPKRAPYSLEAA